jgi:hypothetical protein
MQAAPLSRKLKAFAPLSKDAVIAHLSSLQPQLRTLRCALSFRQARDHCGVLRIFLRWQLRVNPPSILSLATRRQRIARFPALHVDCARSAQKPGRYRFHAEKLSHLPKGIGKNKRFHHSSRLQQLPVTSKRDVLQNAGSCFLVGPHFWG